MKTRIHFAHRIDLLDDRGGILEHLANIESFELARACYLAALELWPKSPIMLRQDARVVLDSRKPRVVKR
jgi:hypothetical protein